MKPEYAEWIEKFLDRCDGRPHGKCGSTTREMVAAFPELRRVAGYAYWMGNEIEHFWCETPDGEIVDPTVSQFPGGVTAYVPWRPGVPVRVGRCMNCGDDIMRSVQSLDESGHDPGLCSEQCFKEMKAYLDG